MASKTTIAVIAVVIVVVIGVGVYAALTTYGHGTLNLSVADTPVNSNVSAVYITFSAISLHSTSSGWTNYTISSRTVNIYGVTLNNSSFLGSLSIPAGNYTMIRVYVSSVSVDMAGTNESFAMASHAAFLNHPFTVKALSTTHLTFEFNLNQCLNLNSKVFTPYIGVVVS
jgi:hypothetical protein